MSIEPSTVSVIIPTWNRADTLVAAINSALVQTLPPLEVLVCDDGSTDDSQQRVAALDHPRVRWLDGPRAGRPAIPRNRGIAAARGEWLAFLDSDDLWAADKLEAQMRSVQRSGYKACCTDAWRVVPGETHPTPLLGGEDRVLDFAQLVLDNRVICSSAFVHRSLFHEAEGFPEPPDLKAIEDYALWLRLACLTSFDYLAARLVSYADNPAQSVRAHDRNVWAQRALVLRDLHGWQRRHSFAHKKGHLAIVRRERARALAGRLAYAAAQRLGVKE